MSVAHEQPPADLVERVAAIMPDGNYELLSQKGNVMGMERNVKPGFAGVFDVDRLNQFTDRLSPAQKERYLLTKSFLIDKIQLAERLQQESRLAQQIGWDRSKSMEDNLIDMSTNITSMPIDQARAGFVLGFPETAIVSFREYRQLVESNVPKPDELIEATLDPVRMLDLHADEWSPRGQSIVRILRTDMEHVRNRVARFPEGERGTQKNILMFRLIEKHGESLEELYRDEMHLSAHQADLMSYQTRLNFTAPTGEPIYNFMTYGRGSGEAEDVLALRNKVAAAFADNNEMAAK